MVLRGDRFAERVGSDEPDDVAVTPPRAFIVEPDGALLRSALLAVPNVTDVLRIGRGPKRG